MKKLFTLCFGLLLAAGFSVQATADEPVNCVLSGMCNSTVSWSLDTCTGVLTIAGTDTMPNYTMFSPAPWDIYKQFITSVEVEEGVLYVGEYAFYQLYNVTNAKLPSTLQKIRAMAFGSCRSLEKVELQSVPNYLNLFAFDQCVSLDTIYCPCNEALYTGLNSYDMHRLYSKLYRSCDKRHPAFYGYCGAPRSATNLAWRFEDGLLSFTGSGAMSDFLVLEEDYLFWGDLWDYIENISLPEGLTVIGANAFMGCANVHTVVIPSSVTEIHEDAFNACFGMDTVFMSTPAADLTWVDELEILPDFKENKATICWLPTVAMKNAYAAKFTNVNVTFATLEQEPETPELVCVDTTNTCGDNLIWAVNCTGDTLLITGTGAMYDYSYRNPVPWINYRNTITTVLLPEGLTHLGDWSLYQLSELTSVVIPEGVTSLGYVALAACGNLASVTLPSTLLTIANGVFSEDWALQSLTIPASVQYIESRITEGCTSLTNLVVEAGNQYYDSRDNCNAIIQTATNKLIAGCKVTVIPNTVVIIGDQAFSSQRTMTQIKLPTSVTTLEEYCFQYCSNVKALNLPTSVVNIHGEAFTGCCFNEINVITGNPRYDSRDNCNAIIETATNTLVKGCANTVIPDGIVAIGEGAFMSDKNIRTINIPASVDTIAHNGFIYCSNLQAITSLATVPPAVGPQGFNYGTIASININPAIPVYVPGPSLAAYQAAPGWNYFTNFVALDSYYNVKALANHGSVTGTGTYAANATVQLVATPEEGFRFKQWSDGSTEATKSFVVTRDTTLRAFFELVVQEEQTIVAGQTTLVEIPEITITFEPIDDALFYELKVYMNGNLVATVKIDANGQIAGDIVWAAPSRIQARTMNEEPSVYQVNLSNLEFGQDYTFTLDTYNEAEECISAQSGSFNVPEQETPTCVENVAGKNAQVESVKVLENGILYILRNGVKYDAQGAIVK